MRISWSLGQAIISGSTEDGDLEGDDFLPKNDQWLSTSFSRAHESDRAAETTF